MICTFSVRVYASSNWLCCGCARLCQLHVYWIKWPIAQQTTTERTDVDVSVCQYGQVTSMRTQLNRIDTVQCSIKNRLDRFRRFHAAGGTRARARTAKYRSFFRRLVGISSILMHTQPAEWQSFEGRDQRKGEKRKKKRTNKLLFKYRAFWWGDCECRVRIAFDNHKMRCSPQ